MKTRFLSFLLVGVLVVSTLVGCVGEENKKEPVSNNEITNEDSSEDKEILDEGPKMVTVNLVNAGAAKVNVIKVIKEITGLGLKESKDIADNGGAVKENISVDEANEIKANLEEAGAVVEVK